MKLTLTFFTFNFVKRVTECNNAYRTQILRVAVRLNAWLVNKKKIVELLTFPCREIIQLAVHICNMLPKLTHLYYVQQNVRNNALHSTMDFVS